MQRFEVICVLGEGAAGAVYRVRDNQRPGQDIALKILINDAAFDEHTAKRFKKEWEVSANLRHPNITAAYDWIECDDAIAYTMEFVEGKDLGGLIHSKKFSFAEMENIFDQVLSALSYLHIHGVLHRDIKLENVLLATDGKIKLTDLGLMKLQRQKKLTETGILLGTAQYMPPEYIKDGRFDERGDIYAVGVLMYELISGNRWLAHLNGNQAIQHLIKNKFTFPEFRVAHVPERFNIVLKKALAADPKERFHSAHEMRDMLRASDPLEQLRTLEKNRKQGGNLSGLLLSSGRALRRSVERRLKLLALTLTLAGGAICAYGVHNYISAPDELKAGSYQGALSDWSGSRSETFSLQIGSKAGVWQSDGTFCQNGELNLDTFVLTCGMSHYKMNIEHGGGGLIQGRLFYFYTLPLFEFSLQKSAPVVEVKPSKQVKNPVASTSQVKPAGKIARK